ncbi:MAG: polyprenyl synthetase family protein, partial [Bacteroidota bacterium]|nr:polyprenyl synthetase family protein [Bacteroidota bacterium]
IKNENRRKEKVAQVIDIVQHSGGIDYTRRKMEEYRDKSLDLLHHFSPSEARQSLEELVLYTTDRKY